MNNFIIFGASGSGKDTTANLLQFKYGYKRIHPIAPLKKWLSNYFIERIGDKSLDDASGKSIQMNLTDGEQLLFTNAFTNWLTVHTDLVTEEIDCIISHVDSLIESTFGDFMIKLWHIGNKYNLPITHKYMTDVCADDSVNKVFVAIRNKHEALLLRQLPSYSIISLHRQNITGLSTDSLQLECKEMLLDYCNYHIEIRSSEEIIEAIITEKSGEISRLSIGVYSSELESFNKMLGILMTYVG